MNSLSRTPVDQNYGNNVNFHDLIKATNEDTGIFSTLITGKKIYINGINTLVGHSIFEELRNDHIAIHTGEVPNIFYASINKKQQSCDRVPVTPTETIKILDFQNKPRSFKKHVQDCDIFVLDILTPGTDMSEIDFLVKLIRSLPDNLQTEKTVVVVSTVMTWSCTSPKLVEIQIESDQEDQEDEMQEYLVRQQQKLNSDLIMDDSGDQPTRRKHVFKQKVQTQIVQEAYSDKDFNLRVPPPRFQNHKQIENLLMAAQKSKRNLRVHVVCSGLTYGKGETNEIFYEFYRRAWLGLHKKLATLPIIDQGLNILPTIHVLDLGRIVRMIINNKYKQQYFIAKDLSKHTLQSIIQTISTSVGCELQPSAIFSEYNNWHSKDGICSTSIEMLVKEFNTYRGLFPLKIFVTGPPASGMTHYSKLISEKYGIPHIKIEDIIKLRKGFKGELGEQIKAFVKEQKNIIVAAYEKTKKKKDPELDRKQIKVRLPDVFIAKLLKIRLSTSECKNKGFILDGFPKNFIQAKEFYLREIPDYDQTNINEESFQIDPFPGYDIKMNLLPDYIIQLTGEDFYLKQRIKETLPADKIQDTHYTDQHMDRRLKIYREQNSDVNPNQLSVQGFFKKVLPLNKQITLNCMDQEVSLKEEITAFIEKDGKPCCLNLINDQDIKLIKRIEHKKKQKKLQKQLEELDNQEEKIDKIQELQAKLEKLKDSQVEQNNELDLIRQQEQEQIEKQQEDKEKQAQIERFKFERKQNALREQQKLIDDRQNEVEILDKRTQPIRQYLMDNIVSHVMQGLVELCKQVPGDPIDYLADYLLLKADEIDQMKLQEREAEIKLKMEEKLNKKK
eukprot:403364574